MRRRPHILIFRSRKALVRSWSVTWRQKRTNSVVSWAKKPTNSGCGWRWTFRAARSLRFMSAKSSRKGGRRLWNQLPAVYRQHATFYTDAYAPYGRVIPKARHRVITKAARKANHVERFNGTLRQRLSRLVRSTLSFSKNLAHHIGAIRYFLCHYNLTRAARCKIQSIST